MFVFCMKFIKSITRGWVLLAVNGLTGIVSGERRLNHSQFTFHIAPQGLRFDGNAI
jgi:hypothetical protein